MPKEVKEETFMKLKREDVGNLKTFYATACVSNAVEKWKHKSVTIIPPKSGRILRQKEKPITTDKKSKYNDTSFFSRLFEDFKKEKVSDFEYQQSKVRENSSYKPFWATKVVGAEEETDMAIEEPEIKTKSFIGNNNANVYNKAFIFEKETQSLSPEAILTKKVGVKKSSQDLLPKLPTVHLHNEYKLKKPRFYNGSKMYMPTGEQLFWLGETRPSLFGPATYQDFKDIRSRCLADGRLFEDPEFPAIDRSLYYKESLDRPITWLRPGEISDTPQLFVEGYSRFDVQQGELGDCWLLAAVANLTLHRKLFFQVVPDDQSFDEEYAGVFHFRFWRYGRWVDVVIDDRLPTYRGKLVFLHSTETNEFWSALLEKAYAKLHGSYEALKGGTTCEAMEDFTGGVTEVYEMQELLPPNFYTILLKAYERNSLMGCSIEPDPNVIEAKTQAGLIRGHAYSVTRVKYVDIKTPGRAGKIPLLRVRNPWGNEAEWNGAWSDKSPEWRFIPESEKEELGLNFDDDGEFWMAYKDFTQHFHRVEICNLNPDSLDPDECPEGCTKKWEMSVFEGEWVRGVTAGGCRNYLESFWRNPQYTITLKDVDEDDDDDKCTIIIALMQKNRRSQRHQGLESLTIGFAVYRLPDGHVPKPLDVNFFKYNKAIGRSQAFINLREVSARFKFEPGHYVIVPSAYEPNEEGEFLLRVFSEKDNNMSENDEDIGMGDVDDRVKEIAPNPEPADPVREFFARLAGADGEVDWQELKEILDYAMREELGMRQVGAYDGGGGGNGLLSSPPQQQGCLEQLLCALCAPIYKRVDLQQVQQQPGEHVLLNQPQPTQEMKGQGFSKDVCRSMIAMLDKDGSGGLGFEEFKSLWIDLRNWRAVFRLYDTEGRGAVPARHLRDALHSAGYSVNAHILNVLAHRYGSSDGYIEFDDFIMCAVRLKTMIGNNEPLLENLERDMQWNA